MIIVQTPLRVSFFGGGTDFPTYFRENGGAVLSSTIDKYIFVTIKHRFDEYLRVGYTRTELVETLDEIKHDLIREALRKVNVSRGVEITTMGDIPSQGSGLGSSSTVTVGVLQAIYAFTGKLVTAEQLAREACEIEIDILGKPIGFQDQYIAAYGGLRFIEFNQDGSVCTQQIELSDSTIRKMNDSFLLFFTGLTRKSDDILVEQKQNIYETSGILSQLKEMAYTARKELESANIQALGELLHESWLLKKQLAGKISSPSIDNLYESAIRAGATGGKITGAGGGGFFLVYCEHDKQDAVREALVDLQELPFQLERDGSKVIFNYRRKNNYY